MKFLSTFVLLAALSVFAEAGLTYHDHVHRSHHKSILRRASGDNRRCKQRPATTNNTGSNSGGNNTNNSNGGSQGGNSNGGTSPNTSGLITVQVDRCGPNGATQQVTATTGPNGAIDWLNCGVEGAGWNPPYIRVTDLVTVNLDDAVAQGGPFGACQPYLWAFKQYGGEFGLPPILLASISLQESSCNPNTVGGAGEQGLMQLTHEKCGDAPGGNCLDVGYNVRTGAKYFSDQLAANGGDFLKTLGMYNGWEPGMNVGYATRMRWSFCRAQNNLDYLFQTVNGWLLNKDAYSLHLGKYFNLAGC